MARRPGENESEDDRTDEDRSRVVPGESSGAGAPGDKALLRVGDVG
jgi:hypothetical protein